ncbi:MAG: carbohydrate kinase [Oscillospiraceae bacterium]|nr:carbohydrate kinase [Oscillospiraceae bacterium]
MYDVIAIGELLIDFTLDRLQEDGYPVMAAHPGGAPANFLAPLARYGRKTAMLTKVGNDALGRQLEATVRAAGIDSRGVVLADDVFTTLAFVTRDAQGEREFSFARKPGADLLLGMGDVDLSMVDETRVLHFGTVGMTGGPSRDTHHQVVEYARRAGKLITFDPNLREPLWADLEDARREMLWGIGHADVVKISDNEVEFLFGCPVEEAAAQMLRDYGVKLVFVTLGRDGAYFRNQNGEGRVPGLTDLEVVDTTGAGDIFGGSAVCGLLESGKAPEELTTEELRRIARFACAAASLSTTKLGGISSVPPFDDVRRAAAQG